ncbi:hypothetical protein M7I_5608 [Glarea lozoyensis 74030]|uniref:Uncharacterized protein n=1 Tax=Glarea lozoyensis (strain ATCC 74030 / MF5533) TaxID=1104152 RepID=H0ESC9_GLAL7|nr:hypothetical protein M7I_5608 [Glarea lozoyensis 74030]
MASSSPPNIASSPRLYSSTGSPVLRVRRTTTPTITSSPPSTPPAARNKRIKNVAQETKEWVIDYATEHGLGNTLTADQRNFYHVNQLAAHEHHTIRNREKLNHNTNEFDTHRNPQSNSRKTKRTKRLPPLRRRLDI